MTTSSLLQGVSMSVIRQYGKFHLTNVPETDMNEKMTPEMQEFVALFDDADQNLHRHEEQIRTLQHMVEILISRHPDHETIEKELERCLALDKKQSADHA